MDDNERITKQRYQAHVELARNVRATIRQFTGRQYASLERNLEIMTVETLSDLQRLLRDAQYEVQRAKNDAVSMPWRR